MGLDETVHVGVQLDVNDGDMLALYWPF